MANNPEHISIKTEPQESVTIKLEAESDDDSNMTWKRKLDSYHMENEQQFAKRAKLPPARFSPSSYMSETGRKEKRSQNFTASEIQLLISVTFKYDAIINNKQSSGILWKEKKSAWEKITQEFNLANDGIYRTISCLQSKYKLVKAELKEKSDSSTPHHPPSAAENSNSGMSPMSESDEEYTLSNTNKMKKKKKKNFTDKENQLLINLAMKYGDVINCKESSGLLWKKKNNAWKKIAEEFNNTTDYVPRTPVCLKNKYKLMKKIFGRKNIFEDTNVKEDHSDYVSHVTPSLLEVVFSEPPADDSSGLVNHAPAPAPPRPEPPVVFNQPPNSNSKMSQTIEECLPSCAETKKPDTGYETSSDLTETLNNKVLHWKIKEAKAKIDYLNFKRDLKLKEHKLRCELLQLSNPNSEMSKSIEAYLPSCAETKKLDAGYKSSSDLTEALNFKRDLKLKKHKLRCELLNVLLDKAKRNEDIGKISKVAVNEGLWKGQQPITELMELSPCSVIGCCPLHILELPADPLNGRMRLFKCPRCPVLFWDKPQLTEHIRAEGDSWNVEEHLLIANLAPKAQHNGNKSINLTELTRLHEDHKIRLIINHVLKAQNNILRPSDDLLEMRRKKNYWDASTYESLAPSLSQIHKLLRAVQETRKKRENIRHSPQPVSSFDPMDIMDSKKMLKNAKKKPNSQAVMPNKITLHGTKMCLSYLKRFAPASTPVIMPKRLSSPPTLIYRGKQPQGPIHHIKNAIVTRPSQPQGKTSEDLIIKQENLGLPVDSVDSVPEALTETEIATMSIVPLLEDDVVV